jgi:hypothetical protein
MPRYFADVTDSMALVRPKLEYGCSVWDPHTNEYKKKIEMVQRQPATL